ncbi:NAC domain-containing protein 7-like isoform X2 [Gossypium australe]|uniref:NAC domain-containing protein 7-like isoform X2 n=1 Tax=Gossypium australe TaxID=47621 RepID=A0A5B6VJ44_9ROSI|nr:NAC domain-containing protein 7-like isoform X2 [Gossypium australe]
MKGFLQYSIFFLDHKCLQVGKASANIATFIYVFMVYFSLQLVAISVLQAMFVVVDSACAQCMQFMEKYKQIELSFSFMLFPEREKNHNWNNLYLLAGYLRCSCIPVQEDGIRWRQEIVSPSDLQTL